MVIKKEKKKTDSIENDDSPAIYQDTSQVSELHQKLTTFHSELYTHLANRFLLGYTAEGDNMNLKIYTILLW